MSYRLVRQPGRVWLGGNANVCADVAGQARTIAQVPADLPNASKVASRLAGAWNATRVLDSYGLAAFPLVRAADALDDAMMRMEALGAFFPNYPELLISSWAAEIEPVVAMLRGLRAPMFGDDSAESLLR